MNKTFIESEIAKRFLNIYNFYHKDIIIFDRIGSQGKINEPDIICKNGLGIEIFSNQYSQQNKRDIEVKLKDGDQYVLSHDFLSPDKMAFDFILEKIKSKEGKIYHFNGSILLLIDCRDNPITTMKDFKKFFNDNPIKKSRFSEIRLFNSRAWISTPYDGLIGEIESLQGSLCDDEYIIYKIF